jgi:predicted lipoprotein with Yx(FWY)xxD motif
MSVRILIGASAAALALVTACSSSTSHGTSGGGGSSSGSGSGSGASGTTISAVGGMLTGPDGHTLYANTVDTASKITCTGACATTWPPVTGTPSAGSGVTASELGTVKRPDGAMQVTFEGHPLYEFVQDTKAGDHKGDGIADAGGSWHAETVGAGASSTPAQSSGGSSGYNY